MRGEDSLIDKWGRDPVWSITLAFGWGEIQLDSHGKQNIRSRKEKRRNNDNSNEVGGTKTENPKRSEIV
jgi:hypothetical protein